MRNYKITDYKLGGFYIADNSYHGHLGNMNKPMIFESREEAQTYLDDYISTLDKYEIQALFYGYGTWSRLNIKNGFLNEQEAKEALEAYLNSVDDQDKAHDYRIVYKPLKRFEVFYGDGYRLDPSEPSKLEYHDQYFFWDDNGYDWSLIEEIEALEIGQSLNSSSITTEQWIRRMK